MDVEHWFRGDEGWQRRVHTSLTDVIALPTLGIDLPVAEVYEGVERIPA